MIDLTKVIRPDIQALRAYHVPDSAGLLKLDAMENPYVWPGEALYADWLQALQSAELNRYPDPSARILQKQIRTAMAVPDACAVVLGNGSDELIQMLALAVAGPDRVVLAPEPSFVMYRMTALFAGMQYLGVPLQSADFSLDLEQMLSAIAEHQPVLIYLAYPNNPTGNCFAPEHITAIIEAAPGLVVVDEAYYAFAPDSFMARVPQYDNLLLLRTVSKIGLAGLRLGCLIGASRWLHEIDKIRLPYNINTLTQVSACFALRHAEQLAVQAAEICHQRDDLHAALAAMPGLTVYPSAANFILLRAQPGCGEKLFAELKNAGVLIKNLHASSPLLRDCLRVTVGSEDQNRIFLDTLKSIMPS